MGFAHGPFGENENPEAGKRTESSGFLFGRSYAHSGAC